MQTRYLMEMFYFFFIVTVFQLNLTYFTSAWNSSLKFFKNAKDIDNRYHVALAAEG